MRFTPDDVSAALDELTQKDVVSELVRLDCHGHRDNRHSCPIARYLANRFDVPMCHVEVDTAHVLVDGAGGCSPLPLSLREFVRDFDNGIYPNLVRDGV